MPKPFPTSLANSLSPNAEAILALIQSYQRIARLAIGAMNQRFQATNILSALADGQIPRHGKLEQGSFAFHGVGCRFQLSEGIIDIDFGPNGRFDGFDAWRLMLFAQENSRQLKCPKYTQEQVQRGIDELLKAGEIVSPKLEPSPHLYYLN